MPEMRHASDAAFWKQLSAVIHERDLRRPGDGRISRSEARKSGFVEVIEEETPYGFSFT